MTPYCTCARRYTTWTTVPSGDAPPDWLIGQVSLVASHKIDRPLCFDPFPPERSSIAAMGGS